MKLLRERIRSRSASPAAPAKICPQFKQYGTCTYGDQCSMSHGDAAVPAPEAKAKAKSKAAKAKAAAAAKAKGM